MRVTWFSGVRKISLVQPHCGWARREYRVCEESCSAYAIGLERVSNACLSGNGGVVCFGKARLVENRALNQDLHV
jgi:hypothetical protein